MLAVLATTAPIFVLIALGYAAVRTGLMPAESIPVLGRFVLYFPLPALIFHTLAGLDFHQVVHPHFMMAYGGGSLLLFTLGLFASRALFRSARESGGLKALGMAMSNSAFFGYPVLLQVFDDPPTVAFAMALMVENLLIFPLALVVMELTAGGKSDDPPRASVSLNIWKSLLLRVVRNPLILAILAGVAVSAIGFGLPAFLDTSLQMLARVTAAVALFVIGGSLIGNRLQGDLLEISWVVVGKLIFHPLLVLSMIWLLPDFDPGLQMAAVLLAAMPMLSIYPIIGSAYGYRKQCASILLVATLASFLTLSLILGLMPAIG